MVVWAVAAVLRDVSERASLQALVRHLERALDSRAVIERAKGIVMAHHGGTPEEASARPVALSSRSSSSRTATPGGGPASTVLTRSAREDADSVSHRSSSVPTRSSSFIAWSSS
jgi:hypothetical protein